MSYYYCIIAVSILGFIPSMEAYNLKVIESSPKTVVGTAAFWCKETQSLYYCDVFRTEQTILRYCPADGRVYSATVEGDRLVTSFIIPVKGKRGRFIVGRNHTIEEIEWDGKSSTAKRLRIILEVENCPEYATNNFLEGKADQHCRLYAGTRRDLVCLDLDVPTYGNLFRLSADEPPVTLIKPHTIRLSNGMAWDEKISKYYYIDSCDYNIKSFDYCPHTGDLSNKQIIYNYTDDGQSPFNFLKAMTLDKKGYMYVTTFGGSCIIKIDPRTGREMYRIPFPCKLISSVTFAGKRLDCLLVATSSYSITGFGSQSDKAGKLFKVTDLNAYGCEPNKVEL